MAKVYSAPKEIKVPTYDLSDSWKEEVSYAEKLKKFCIERNPKENMLEKSQDSK